MCRANKNNKTTIFAHFEALDKKILMGTSQFGLHFLPSKAYHLGVVASLDYITLAKALLRGVGIECLESER